MRCKQLRNSTFAYLYHSSNIHVYMYHSCENTIGMFVFEAREGVWRKFHKVDNMKQLMHV